MCQAKGGYLHDRTWIVEQTAPLPVKLVELVELAQRDDY